MQREETIMIITAHMTLEFRGTWLFRISFVFQGSATIEPG